MTNLDYAALATAYLEGKDFRQFIEYVHEPEVAEDTIEYLLNLPDVGKAEEIDPHMYAFDPGDEGNLLVNDMVEEAQKALGVPANKWICDDPGTIYLSDPDDDHLWETAAGATALENEVRAIVDCTGAIYNAFRDLLTREKVQAVIDAAMSEKAAQQARWDAERAARDARLANVPRIDQAELERALGITRTGFLEDKLLVLPLVVGDPDVLYVRPEYMAGGSNKDLGEAMRTLLRAGGYLVAPLPGKNFGWEELYVKYVPGKPPRPETGLPSVDAIVAVIEQRMSKDDWAQYLGTLQD